MVAWRNRHNTTWALPDVLEGQAADDGKRERGDGRRVRKADAQARVQEIVSLNETCRQLDIRLRPIPRGLKLAAGGGADCAVFSPFTFRSLPGVGRVAGGLKELNLTQPYLRQQTWIQRIARGENVEINDTALSGKTTAMYIGVLLRILANPSARALMMLTTKPDIDDAIAFFTTASQGELSVDNGTLFMCNSKSFPPETRVGFGTTTHVTATFDLIRDACSIFASDNGLITAEQNKDLVKRLRRRKTTQIAACRASKPNEDQVHYYLQTDDKLGALVSIVKEKVSRCVVFSRKRSQAAVVEALEEAGFRHKMLVATPEMEYGKRCALTNKFIASTLPVLVATDQIPRVQIPVSVVIMYDIAEDEKTYSARCCRASGARSAIISLVDEDDISSEGDDDEGSSGSAESEGADHLALQAMLAAAEQGTMQKPVIASSSQVRVGKAADKLTAALGKPAEEAGPSEGGESEEGDASTSDAADDQQKKGKSYTEQEVVAYIAKELNIEFHEVERGALQPLSDHLNSTPKPSTLPPFPDGKPGVRSWENMMLNPGLMKAMEMQKYLTPTPVQARVVPAVVAEKDLLVRAGPGSGKTVGVCIGLMQKVQWGVIETQAVVIAAAELQLDMVASLLARLSSQQRQSAKCVAKASDASIPDFKTKPQILVATPAAFEIIATGKQPGGAAKPPFDLTHVHTLVVDDAEVVITKKYGPVLAQHIRPEAQRVAIATQLTDCALHQISNVLRLPEMLVSSPAALSPSTIEHFTHKAFVKEIALTKVLKQINAKTLVFCGDVSSLEAPLSKVRHFSITEKSSTEEIYETLNDWKQPKKGNTLLVDSSVLDRGITLPRLSAVVFFDVPPSAAQFLLRSGRCGRNGTPGVCVTLLDALGDIRAPKTELTDEQLAEKAEDRKKEWLWVRDGLAPYKPPVHQIKRRTDLNPASRNHLHDKLKVLAVPTAMRKFIVRLSGARPYSKGSQDPKTFLDLALKAATAEPLTKQEVMAIAALIKKKHDLMDDPQRLKLAWVALKAGFANLRSPVALSDGESTSALPENVRVYSEYLINESIRASTRLGLSIWVQVRKQQRAHVSALWDTWQEATGKQWIAASTGLTALRPKKRSVRVQFGLVGGNRGRAKEEPKDSDGKKGGKGGKDGEKGGKDGKKGGKDGKNGGKDGKKGGKDGKNGGKDGKKGGKDGKKGGKGSKNGRRGK
ncbi:ATP-dependent RNA helicase FAL1 [Diplonema papillatum]|nr:ATP-dependent RNA helicase FAL1 [Diplonema papillatum]